MTARFCAPSDHSTRRSSPDRASFVTVVGCLSPSRIVRITVAEYSSGSRPAFISISSGSVCPRLRQESERTLTAAIAVNNTEMKRRWEFGIQGDSIIADAASVEGQDEKAPGRVSPVAREQQRDPAQRRGVVRAGGVGRAGVAGRAAPEDSTSGRQSAIPLLVRPQAEPDALVLGSRER